MNLSIKQAVDYAHEYLELSPQEWGIEEVTLRPAFNHSGTIIWYYIVELTELPYKFGATSKQAVILTSGEVVLPNKV